jgi:hypothetical protein
VFVNTAVVFPLQNEDILDPFLLIMHALVHVQSCGVILLHGLATNLVSAVFCFMFYFNSFWVYCKGISSICCCLMCIQSAFVFLPFLCLFENLMSC